MKFISDMSIAHKIRWGILSICGLALVIASASYITLEASTYRKALIERISVLADFVSTNSTAALSFDDQRTAQELLTSLSAEESVQRAIIFQNTWEEFAHYLAPASDKPQELLLEGTKTLEKFASLGDTAHHFFEDELHLIKTIFLDGDVIGYFYVEVSLAPLYEELTGFLKIVVMLLVLIMLGVYVLSSSLQRRISGPLRHLVDGMQEVEARHDFSLRIETKSKDEIGVLIERFNRMLKEIEGRDIALAEAMTELREARDHAESASKTKSQFLATMSHEIRTPMNGVLGMTELMLDSKLEDSARRMAEVAHRSAENLLGVINDVLDFSKIEADKLVLSEEDFDLRALLEDTLEIIASQAHQKGLELLPMIPAELTYSVTGDPVRLRQVLINLLGNAVKFTEKGEIKLTVKVSDENKTTPLITFEVSDTGPGITKNQQAHIFDAFSQADSSTTRRYGGTGLGLAITKRLVTLMGGKIELFSETGAGSTFSFTIPIARAEVDLSPPVKTELLQDVRVLIVDDHPVNREILHNQVIAWGMRNGCAASGPEALRMLDAAASEKDPYRVILVDLHMPEMDGLQLTQTIANSRNIPSLHIVMLSSAGFDTENSAVREAGISRFLQKPVRQHQLLECLRDLVSGTAYQPAKTSSARHTFNARILLAEDNLVNQEVGMGMLMSYGCEVDIASDGFEAIRAFSNANYDLILMDCHMPELDGFGATAEIRQLESSLKRDKIPVIAITADVQKGIKEKCEIAGMDDYLSKPIDRDRLGQVLQKWLVAPIVGASEADTSHAEHQNTEATIELDAQSLQQLRDLDKLTSQDILGNAIRHFLEHAPKAISELREAEETEDFNRLHNISHSLKSSSASLGAKEFSVHCAELEASALNKNIEVASAKVNAIADALPAVSEALRAELNVEQINTESQTSGSNQLAKILVIDDDSSFRTMTHSVLGGAGYSVNLAKSGAEALAWVAQNTPDLILLDAIMPDMDGFETCAELKKIPSLHNTPIIMATGLEDSESINRAFATGAAGFTLKPINYSILLNEIPFYLRNAHNAKALHESKDRLADAQRMAGVDYWRFDTKTETFSLSENLASKLGAASHSRSMPLKHFLQYVDDEEKNKVLNCINEAIKSAKSYPLNYSLNLADRSKMVVHQIAQRSASTPDIIIGTIQDITEQEKAQRRIWQLAHCDELTGLRSRMNFFENVNKKIIGARQNKERLALLYIDLDEFKGVNDSLGHDAGDRMLKIIAHRLDYVVQEGDLTARLSGDEFCMLVNNINEERAAKDVAVQCLNTINEPLQIGPQIIRPRCSIGIAHFPEDGDDPQSLLKAADTAMYVAKEEGKQCYAFYEPEMTERAERRLQLEQDLRRAIEQNELELYYQPQVDLKTGKMTGVEALARWNHTTKGMISPAEFIPIAERIGAINTLGEWVLNTACRQAAEWKEMGLAHILVAVNISPSHFQEANFSKLVENVLTETGLTTENLELEVTESVVQNMDDNLDTFHALRDLGLKIAIDDFGTGYSSLASLKSLPITCLKIDRLFIADMLKDANSSILLGLIIDVAQSLGHEVIAEGVELKGQAEALLSMQCQKVQGFYFSRPVKAEQIPALAQTNFLSKTTG